MKKSIILACAFITCGQTLFGGFGDQAKQLREKEEQAAMERDQRREQMKENVRSEFTALGEEAKAAYRAAEYAIGIRVINTASSWVIEVKDPILLGKWVQLPKASSPLKDDLMDENVCYITCRKDFKVRVLDKNTQMPVPGSETTIARGKGQDVFAINVRSVSAGTSVPKISFEAFSAEEARTKFKNLDL
jgi:hypothetical protein